MFLWFLTLISSPSDQTNGCTGSAEEVMGRRMSSQILVMGWRSKGEQNGWLSQLCHWKKLLWGQKYRWRAHVNQNPNNFSVDDAWSIKTAWSSMSPSVILMVAWESWENKIPHYTYGRASTGEKLSPLLLPSVAALCWLHQQRPSRGDLCPSQSCGLGETEFNFWALGSWATVSIISFTELYFFFPF